MIIEKISNTAFKIKLDKDDIITYNINHNDINIKSIKSFLTQISPEITSQLDVSIKDSKFYVEVFSKKTSCTIFVSFIPSVRKKQISESQNIICQFEDFKTLAVFCRTLISLYPNAVKKSIFFCGHNSMRLLLELEKEHESIVFLASGYCMVLPANEINKAITNEYFKEIPSENAVKEILLSVCK